MWTLARCVLSFLPVVVSLFFLFTTFLPLRFVCIFLLLIGVRRASFRKIGGKGEVRGKERPGYPAWIPGALAWVP